MLYRQGFVLFSGDHNQLEEAREYIKAQGFTNEQVRIVKTSTEILVKAKVDLKW